MYRNYRMVVTFTVLFAGCYTFPAIATDHYTDSIIEQKSASHNGFSVSDIPKIKNKTSITMVAETGFWTDFLKRVMVPKFERQTGVKVTVVGMPLGEMYDMQGQAMSGGIGKYDLLAIEAGWAKEWAANGFTTPLLDLAKRYDSAGPDALATYLAPYYEVLLTILTYKGELHSIPYNNYTMGMHYRADLFSSSIEKAAFLKRYGYTLAPPKTLRQLLDVSTFFTRRAGTSLAGRTLKTDFYGVALMADKRPHINDEFSALLWGMGGTWFRPVRDVRGTITGFEVEANGRVARTAAKAYRALLNQAPPQARKWAFLESAEAFANGQVAMWPFAYNNLWPVSAQVENKVPGARAAVASVPLGRPYTGAYAVGVAYDSRNPEASYWLLKYIGSYEGQLAYALGGGNPCRQDVVLDPFFATEERRLVNGAFHQNHLDMERWGNHVQNLGHFTSTAMGRIYPELMRTAHKIISDETNIEDELNGLAAKIETFQNQYGEVPTLR